MPGNTTSYKSPRAFLPSFWTKNDILAGESTGQYMDLAGLTIKELPLPRRSSIVSIGLIVSQAVTAGLIRVELFKNDVATGVTQDITSESGLRKFWEFDPGKFVVDKGDRIGFKWDSSGSLSPSGSIDLAVFVEVQQI